MNTSKKVKMLMIEFDLTASKLASMINMSQPNLSKKLKNNSLSVSDLFKISQALNIELEINFILEDGNKI